MWLGRGRGSRRSSPKLPAGVSAWRIVSTAFGRRLKLRTGRGTHLREGADATGVTEQRTKNGVDIEWHWPEVHQIGWARSHAAENVADCLAASIDRVLPTSNQPLTGPPGEQRNL